MKSVSCLVFLLSMSMGFGCSKTNSGESKKNAEVKVTDPVEDRREDMVGNWRVDLERSRIAGVVEDSNQTFSVAISPTGERLTYQGQVLIEAGQFSIGSVTSNSELTGTFRPKDREVATGVKVSFIGADEMTWTFEGTERIEVLIRDVVSTEGEMPSEQK